MTRILIIIIVTCVLCGCTPVLPCDPCGEISELQTRVYALEGVTETPTLTTSSTPSRTATRTPTVSATFTPTGTPPIYMLSLGSNVTTARPQQRVTLTITWDGGPATLQLQIPQQTCCAVPDVLTWAATGPMSTQLTVLIQSNASGAKMFRAVAYDSGNVLLTSASVFVDVVAADATATPTVTPTPGGGTSVRLAAQKWYTIQNANKDSACLYIQAGAANCEKRVAWGGQELAVKSYLTAGWRCICATLAWAGASRRSDVLIVCDSEIVVSECWLRTFREVADMDGGIACEVRGG